MPEHKGYFALIQPGNFSLGNIMRKGKYNMGYVMMDDRVTSGSIYFPTL
jgi:hypothetical protein